MIADVLGGKLVAALHARALRPARFPHGRGRRTLPAANSRRVASLTLVCSVRSTPPRSRAALRPARVLRLALALSARVQRPDAGAARRRRLKRTAARRRRPRAAHLLSARARKPRAQRPLSRRSPAAAFSARGSRPSRSHHLLTVPAPLLSPLSLPHSLKWLFRSACSSTRRMGRRTLRRWTVSGLRRASRRTTCWPSWAKARATAASTSTLWLHLCEHGSTKC